MCCCGIVSSQVYVRHRLGLSPRFYHLIFFLFAGVCSGTGRRLAVYNFEGGNSVFWLASFIVIFSFFVCLPLRYEMVIVVAPVCLVIVRQQSPRRPDGLPVHFSCSSLLTSTFHIHLITTQILRLFEFPASKWLTVYPSQSVYSFS